MRRLKAASLLSLAALLLFQTTPVQAFDPGMYGIANGQGYLTGFTGNSVPTSNCGFTKANGLPATYLKVLCEGVPVSTKEAFVDYIFDRLDGTEQQKVGASFIIYSMLGYNGSNHGLSRVFPLLPEDDDNAIVKAWKAAVANDDVTVENDPAYAYSTNSAYTRFGTGHDVVFYPESGTGDSLVFKYKGDVIYVVKKNCANPVGGSGFPDVLPEPPPPVTWNITGRTTVSDGSVIPGQTVTFTHYVKNEGTSTSSSITAGTNVTGGVGNARSGIAAGTLGGGVERQVATDTVTIPSGATPGQQFCQRVTFSPESNTSTSTNRGSYACATVGYDYLINPFVTTPPTAVPGNTISVAYGAQNAGTRTNDTQWTYRSFVVPAGANPSYLTSIHDNVTNPATRYAGSSGLVSTAGSPSFTMIANETKSSIHTQSVTIPANVVPGTRYCFVMSVDSRDEAGRPNNRDSIPGCVLIVAAPYVVAAGGDVWSGGSVIPPYASNQGKITGATTQGTNFGSFSEYGIFATGQVNYFGSAGRLGVLNTSGGMAAAPLTFGNVSPLGTYTTAHEIYNPSAAYAASSVVSSSPAPLNGSVATSTPTPITTSGIYKNTASTVKIHIAASVLNPGTRAVVYVPNGTVQIAGDIRYNSVGARSFGALPSLTIIAKNIEVTGATKRIDGLLYAGEQFVSCAEGALTAGASAPGTANITTSGACRDALVVNGALSIGVYVNGKHPVLNRSYGGITEGQPAEIFRMRPEVFLTPYEQAYNSNSSTLRTVKEEELPPRY